LRGGRGTDLGRGRLGARAAARLLAGAPAARLEPSKAGLRRPGPHPKGWAHALAWESSDRGDRGSFSRGRRAGRWAGRPPGWWPRPAACPYRSPTPGWSVRRRCRAGAHRAKARRPSGATATVRGFSPTGIVFRSRPVAASSTLTVLLVSAVTYTLDPSGETAIPSGSTPTWVENLMRPVRTSTPEAWAISSLETN